MEANFNPQTDLPPAGMLNVAQSPYAAPLETVAPGITALINQQRATNEEWPRTLVRLVSTIEATDEQRELLLAQAQRADEGLPPAEIPAVNTASPLASISPLVKWGGLAAVAWLILG